MHVAFPIRNTEKVVYRRRIGYQFLGCLLLLPRLRCFLVISCPSQLFRDNASPVAKTKSGKSYSPVRPVRNAVELEVVLLMDGLELEIGLDHAARASFALVMASAAALVR